MKEKTENNYYGSVTVQGASMQSHYVPAEKPYAVYMFEWGGGLFSIAQRTGTMVTGKVDKDGDVKYQTNGVYNIVSKHPCEIDHCFIDNDETEIESDLEFIGFVGDSIDKKAVINVVTYFQCWTNDTLNCKKLFEELTLAGLGVPTGGFVPVREIEGKVDWVHKYGGEYSEMCLLAKKDVSIRVALRKDNKENMFSAAVLHDLYNQIKAWKEVGVSFERIKITADGMDNERLSEMQNKINELMELCDLYGKYKEKDESFILDNLIKVCGKIDCWRCFYDDFKAGLQSLLWKDYSHVDRDLQWGIEMGLLSREGNIIEFTNVLMQMATWKIM